MPNKPKVIRRGKVVRKGQRKTRVAKAKTRSIKAIVKREISNAIENKYIVKYQYATGANVEFQPATAGLHEMATSYIPKCSAKLNTDFYQILPRLEEGTTTGQRVGTQISVKSLRTRMCFAFPPTYSGSANYQVRVVAFTLKGVKSYDSFNQPGGTTPVDYAGKMAWNASTFGGAEPAPFSLLGGSWWYNQMPVNKRFVNVVSDKTFTMTKGVGVARFSGANEGTLQFIDNGRGTHIHDIVWSPPKKFLYNQNTVTGTGYPENYAPFIIVTFAQMDGGLTVIDSESKEQIVMAMKTALSYEDA